MTALSKDPLGKPGSLVIIESQKQEIIEDVYFGYILLDRKGFGDKNVSFFKREN